jgi:hypothetical protein
MPSIVIEARNAAISESMKVKRIFPPPPDGLAFLFPSKSWLTALN